MEIFPERARITQDPVLGDDVKEHLPETGLLFAHFGMVKYSGWMKAEYNEKKLEFVLWVHNAKHEGVLELSDGQFEQIVKLGNRIWASDNDFQGPVPAAVHITNLILKDGEEMCVWDFPGILIDEVEELNDYLVELITSS